VAVSLEGKTLAVVSIDEQVEEEAEWWEGYTGGQGEGVRKWSYLLP